MEEKELNAALEKASNEVKAAIEKANAENKVALEQLKKDIEEAKKADKTEDISKEVIRIAGELKAFQEKGKSKTENKSLRTYFENKVKSK